MLFIFYTIITFFLNFKSFFVNFLLYLPNVTNKWDKFWNSPLVSFIFFCYTVSIMEEKERYKHLNKYLKEKFGERTLKICIDGGFTCPNRDGTLSTKGCIFCSEKGSGELIRCGLGNNITEKISNQVKNYFESYRSERANKFIAYFQNFTNTYDSLEMLKAKYDSALIDDRIVGLEIATRPDCINKNVVNLLKTIKTNIMFVLNLVCKLLMIILVF